MSLCPRCRKENVVEVVKPLTYRRGDRRIQVQATFYQCSDVAEGAQPYVFMDRALTERADALAKAEWRRTYGEEIPAARDAKRADGPAQPVYLEVQFTSSPHREPELKRRKPKKPSGIPLPDSEELQLTWP